MRRVLWFAPNAGNWVSYRMEHRAANALATAGDEVLVVQCDSVLDAYCQVMAPAGVTAADPPAVKRAVCRECRYAAGIARRHAIYRTAQLSEFLAETDWAWVESVVADVTPQSWDAVEVDGLPVGRYAAYTTMLHHKLPSITDSSDAWREYLADLRGALLVVRAVPAIAKAIAPTHVVAYNALYPANRVFAESFRRRGALLVNLSGGPTVPRRYQTLAVYDGVKASQTMTDSRSFRDSMMIPATRSEILAVEQHVSSLMSAADPWVYSTAASRRPASQIRAALGVRPDAPLAVVIVSSPDETRANSLVDAEYERDQVNGYSSVAEFLEQVLAVCRELPEVDFVFRLHPRLAPNKRERTTSPDLEIIDRMLADLPPNAIVNYPTDEVSLYDLVLVASSAINQSSSAGLEFLAFGVPVVQYDPVRAGIYPADFGPVVPRRDAAAFLRALDEALLAGFDVDRIVYAYRWYASMQVRAVVPLEPLPDAEPGPTVPPPPPARPRAIGRVVPGPLKEFLAMRLQRRRWADDLTGPSLDPVAVDLLERQFEAVTGTTEIWEPYMLLPPDADAAKETAEVLAAVERLSQGLVLEPVEGLGVVRGLLSRVDD